MSTPKVRINNTSRNTLRELADQAILNKASEAYRRQFFLTEVNKAYATLRQDPDVWSQVEKERAEWDATLEDGL